MGHGKRDQLNQQVSTDLGSVVYRAIRDDIILGRLAPNQLITETEVSESLQVSRTPIRQALHRLSAEGLVVSHRRRWMVYRHTAAEIKEIYEVRAALESYAARLAAERASDAMLAQLATMVHKRPLSLTRGDEKMVETNDMFHRKIIELSGNKRLQEQLEMSRRYYFNRQVALVYKTADIRRSQAEHVAILEALQARDPDEAERLVRLHIEQAYDIIANRLTAVLFTGPVAAEARGRPDMAGDAV